MKVQVIEQFRNIANGKTDQFNWAHSSKDVKGLIEDLQGRDSVTVAFVIKYKGW